MQLKNLKNVSLYNLFLFFSESYKTGTGILSMLKTHCAHLGIKAE